jgi:hypothetical protein
MRRGVPASESEMDSANSRVLPVAIIGGGLAGLQAARLVHEAGVGFRIFEARDRLGGRILSADAAGCPAEDGFDLGPSWFWPNMHPAMATALAQLGLAAFPQHDEGDVLVERLPSRPPQRFAGSRQEPHSMRLAGGTGALVRALAGVLPEGSIQLYSWVTRIALEGDHVRLMLRQADGGNESILAAQVIAALPPRLLEASIAFEPAIDPAIRLRWRDTPTWMAPHAKFVAIYDRPFWRTAGLSGMAQSAVGPMGEIHDATTASGAAALFGFLGIDADRREAAGTALLIHACLDQLVRLFGDEAGLITVSALARPELQRAGAHAAGAVAALSLGVAMVLSDQWLTLAIALFLPPLAWIEARANLRSLRLVAIAVAGVVLVRLLLNPWLLDYNISTAILLNGFFIAYGVPAASFVIAATIFLRRGDDLAVAVLEAGAVALATALFVVEVRHAIGGGEITGGTFSLNEAAWQLAGLALFSTVLRALNRRLGNRVVLRYCWQAQLGAALVLGVLLLLQNPLFIEGLTLVRMPVLNELLLAYALPAVLAGLAARAPETADHPSARQFLGLYTMLASFAWITLEVRHVFQPDTMIFWSHRPSGAELYAYSGAWLVLAGGLFTLGVRAQLPALRLAALGIIATVVAKAFLVDMSDLVGLWRVLSFLGLGLSLIALSWVYRRFVVEPTK